ncbi:hypothetical protein CASFOL_014408 [Castilleja foliolosa]|uniref:GBF-interacting protein 1 N-terminal domain-containing protein n=1 Tax=Castilleja foliolosa TaxID=1961234 RepID=A0ABD3DNC8_9LAMI
MSTSRGSGGGTGGGAQPVPAGLKKIVQSLKEIVNCPEAEIYAILKDCNMDPDEAVNRLLSQDPFHEVKSKREKKKEGKDTTEPRSRGTNHNSSRGGKTSSSDRYLNSGGSKPYNYSESAPGISSHKKENGLAPYANSFTSTPAVSENNRSRGFSDGASAENKGSSFGTAGAVQPASGYQSAWSGAPGQVSMADIVKMGRTHNNTASNAPHQNQRFPDHDLPTTDADWPSIEKPPSFTNVISVAPESTVDSEQYLEASGVVAESVNRPYEAEEVEEEEEYDDTENYGENYGINNVGSDSISSRNILDKDSRSASLFENDLYKNMGSYQHQAHDFHEVEDIDTSLSSVTRNLQQLNVEEDDRVLPSDGYTTSVIIPDHLQVQIVDCSHLSFGSFEPKTTLPVKSNIEELHNNANVSSVGHLNNRNSEYYVEDSLGNASDGGLFHRNSANAGSYDPLSASQQQQDLKPENAEVAHGNQYSYPPSNPGYTFDDVRHLNAPFSQASPQMQNLASFSNDMQSYTNSLTSALLPANVHAGREPDLQFSQFPVTHSMATKYGNLASAIDGSAISVSEALKTAAGFLSTQPSAPQAQTLSGTNVATGPPLPQHLAVHPYSQAALHLGGPYGNMIGYPFLPQSYTYMPSAFQQTFAGANSTYHQSLAALLPQYKNVSASSLPQSAAAAAAGYGGGAFGNTTTVPGNFQMKQPAAAPPSGTDLSYDDVLSSQYIEYKDNSHLVSLQQQQNENSGMWLHGHNSRAMSGVPANTYYNYQQQGQNQQTGGGFRQGQQPSQNYGAHRYPNIYHSQSGGISLAQQQNPRDGSLGNSQGQPKQSQLWQNGY